MPDQNGNTIKRIDMFIHFAELAAENKVKVIFTKNHPDAAYFARPATREISTRPIRNTGYYVSALHELGHIVGPHQSGEGRLMAEYGAWKWAKENAIVWTETAERVMKDALTSYARRSPVRAQSMPDDFHGMIHPIFSIETGETV